MAVRYLDDLGLVGLDVDGGHGAYRLGREAGARQPFRDERVDLVGGYAPAGADAEYQRRWPVHQVASTPVRSVIAMTGPVSSSRVDSAGSGQVASAARCTPAPSRSARLTGPGRVGSASRKPRSAPNVSSAVRPVASVAVLTTGRAPSTSATRSARALAPPPPGPPWPPRSAMACAPASSTHTTPGSVCLSDSSGARSRTVAPVARKQTRAVDSRHAVWTCSATGPLWTVVSSGHASARRRAIARPAAVALTRPITAAPRRRGTPGSWRPTGGYRRAARRAGSPAVARLRRRTPPPSAPPGPARPARPLPRPR